MIIDAYDKISDLARRYSSAVSREQSFVNRILGAAAIGAGGIGGMMLASGIEATIISDAAASGLYDNASVGKTDGGYTSVYRALTQEQGKDSQDIITQASETNRKITTGEIVGSVGVVGGTVGNILINNVFDDTNKNDNNKK